MTVSSLDSGDDCFEMFLPFLSLSTPSSVHHLGLTIVIVTCNTHVHEMKMLLLLQMMMVMDAVLHLYLLFSNLSQRQRRPASTTNTRLYTHLLLLFTAIRNLKK